VVAARDAELAETQATLVAREDEIANAVTQVHALKDMLAARERELAEAALQLDALRAIVASREEEIAAALEQLQALRALVSAREADLANAAVHIQGLQDILAARDAEIAASSHAHEVGQKHEHQVAELTRQLRAAQDIVGAQQQALAQSRAQWQLQADELQALRAQGPWEAVVRKVKGKTNAP
ncbi:MAG: hypothetical protein H7Z19_17985, partial [Chitinophagaceae bacterium]|nr:hypothetical protein [Rubrivivax sp.]